MSVEEATARYMEKNVKPGEMFYGMIKCKVAEAMTTEREKIGDETATMDEMIERFTERAQILLEDEKFCTDVSVCGTQEGQHPMVAVNAVMMYPIGKDGNLTKNDSPLMPNPKTIYADMFRQKMMGILASAMREIGGKIHLNNLKKLNKLMSEKMKKLGLQGKMEFTKDGRIRMEIVEKVEMRPMA
jgi:hypothetical protein